LNRKFKFFKAKKKDSKFLFNLYNNGVLEGFFKNKKKISFSHHKIWLNKVLSEKKNFIFICAKGNSKIGYIKYDKITKKTSSISIIFKENFRKNNISSYFLQKTLIYLRKYSEIVRVYAEVLKSNKRSQKFFKNNKFILKRKSKLMNSNFDKKNLIYYFKNEKK